MRTFFDSSVLIPVFYADHPHHEASSKAFLSSRKDDSFCALHTLAEVYASLTGLPIHPRITGNDGLDIVRQIRERLTLVSLNEAEYLSVLEAIAGSIIGGATYDAMIARCAIKAGAEILLTWNLRDFTRFGPEIEQLVKTPLQLHPGQ